MQMSEKLPAASSKASRHCGVAEVIGLLRRASLTVDPLSNHDLKARGVEDMRLGEATHRVHQCFIARSGSVPAGQPPLIDRLGNAPARRRAGRRSRRRPAC